MRFFILCLAAFLAVAAPAWSASTSATTAQITKIEHGGTGADLSATGGAGKVLKQEEVGASLTVGSVACQDLTDAATSCHVDATNASNYSQGTLAPSRLGSGTPNASNVLRGDSTWGSATMGTISCASLTNGATSCSTDATNSSNIATGTVGTARLGSGTANSSVYLRGDRVWATPPAAATGFTTCAVSSSYTITEYGCNNSGTASNLSIVGTAGCRSLTGNQNVTLSYISCH